jgi:hypothetical protein
LVPEFVGGMDCSITSTTSGHEAWPEVKPVLRRTLEIRRLIAGEGW